MKKVAELKNTSLIRRKTIWRQKILETGNWSSRHLWTSLRGTKEELQVIEHDGCMVMQNQAILTTLYEYFSALTHMQDGQQKPRNESIMPENLIYGPRCLRCQ